MQPIHIELAAKNNDVNGEWFVERAGAAESSIWVADLFQIELQATAPDDVVGHSVVDVTRALSSVFLDETDDTTDALDSP